MIDRIPGISLALNGNRNNRGKSRGLGSGEGEILINGQRTTGKNNEGRSQLSRIAADQVDYIQIIRGTSDDMDIRGGGQVVNVVLLDAQSRSSISAELNMDRLHDGTVDPGAKLSYTLVRMAHLTTYSTSKPNRVTRTGLPMNLALIQMASYWRPDPRTIYVTKLSTRPASILAISLRRAWCNSMASSLRAIRQRI